MNYEEPNTTQTYFGKTTRKHPLLTIVVMRKCRIWFYLSRFFYEFITGNSAKLTIVRYFWVCHSLGP